MFLIRQRRQIGMIVLGIILLARGCNFPRAAATVLPPVVIGNATPTTVSLLPSPSSQEAMPITPSATATSGMEPTRTTLPSPTSTFTPIPPPASQPNVILIIVDSLRADHLSSYGYDRPTTPNLDQLVVQNGARFSMAISPASWTWGGDWASTTTEASRPPSRR